MQQLLAIPKTGMRCASSKRSHWHKCIQAERDYFEME